MTEQLFSNYTLFLLVFTRMSGAFLFNPFIGRKTVPAPIKIGLALIVSFLITPGLAASWPQTQLGAGITLAFMLALLKELFIGYVMGFFVSLFTSFILVAGEISDIQTGLGMAKVYDPQSNASLPLTGTVYNLMLTLAFFSMNGHLTLIKMAARSCAAFPAGAAVINTGIGAHLALLFGNVLELSLKLALPVIAAQLLTEAGVGILMRTVPQINVFVAGIQIKLLLALIVLMLLMPVASGIIGGALDNMFGQMENAMILMLGG